MSKQTIAELWPEELKIRIQIWELMYMEVPLITLPHRGRVQWDRMNVTWFINKTENHLINNSMVPISDSHYYPILVLLPLAITILNLMGVFLLSGYFLYGRLVTSIYLSSLPVAHLSDTPRRWLVVTWHSARILDETAESSSWFSAHSIITQDCGLTSYPKDYW